MKTNQNRFILIYYLNSPLVNVASITPRSYTMASTFLLFLKLKRLNSQLQYISIISVIANYMIFNVAVS
jgi:hypothetical protein